ncbi:TonB-dependent receptor [Sphingomonas sp. NIBR02145]|uniref:TonB-dependent receptor n=1 Tax=Sphingomonas sp. NIBR02145 TaxID=3014784 RepID=UPI0022B34E28|nr:TonB-dependent receptor [Sphingomonas sp. NIBR02145]WHU02494.1 TonB-dependent receptor [Sphingomonas sp. NIBR02145]
MTALLLGPPCRYACALLLPALSLTVGAAPAGAQEARTVHLDLPAGPVSTALRAIALQAGASFGTDDPALLRRRARRLRFDGGIDKAIETALAGTGLVARRVAPGSWRVAAAPPRSRPRPFKPPPPQVAPDIVVTGSKMDVSLAHYPASVAVIDGSDIAHVTGEHGTLAIAELHPTLLSTRLGPGRNKLFLRGISDSSFSGASPSLVGQYLGDQRLAYASPDPDLRLYDIERVEVLEGPQGSLYGAGSLGGVLRIVPNAPDPRQVSGEAWAGASATAHGAGSMDAGLVANLPHGERAAVRVLGYHEKMGGYIDDVGRGKKDINGTQVTGGRIAAHTAVGARWSLDLTAIGQNVRNADAQYEERMLGRLVRASAFAQPSHHFYRALAVSVAGPLAGGRLQSSWGLVDQRLSQVFDATQPDEEPIAYRQRDHISLLSSETRLTRSFGKRWDALIGFAALRSIAIQARSTGAPLQPVSLGTLDSRVREATVFGEARWHPDDRLTVSAGGRVSFIEMRGAATGVLAKPAPGTTPAPPLRRQRLSTPSLALAWMPVSRATLYLRYAGGYRPGGLTVSGAIERFTPDTARTAEIGFRMQAWESTGLQIEGALARTDWRNVQADTVDGLGLPHTANVGDGIVRTATFQFRLSPARGVTVAAGGFVADSTLVGWVPYLEQTVRSPLPNVARHGAVLSLGYEGRTASGSNFRANLRAHSLGRSILGFGPELAIEQGDYAYFSGNLSLDIGRTTLSLEAFNLFDTRGNIFALGTPFTLGTTMQGTPLRPRTVRLSLLRRSF